MENKQEDIEMKMERIMDLAYEAAVARWNHWHEANEKWNGTHDYENDMIVKRMDKYDKEAREISQLISAMRETGMFNLY